MATSPYAAEFPLDPAIIWLNHAGVGPWPRRTCDALVAFADENLHQGALGYGRWMQCEQKLRSRIAALINAPSADDVALLKNTSEGLSTVAGGYPWQPGDNVVIGAGEFPSNRWPWEALRNRGVTVRIASATDNPPEDALLEGLDGRTRILAVSAVQYADGLRMNLPRLGAACRQNGTLLCVDAIQQLGALDFDMQAVGADIVVADGHKWLLSPEGTAVFCINEAARARIAPINFGWHMAEHAGDFDRQEWQPASSARRYECGSPNMGGIQALSASLEFLLEAGMANVERQVLANAAFLAREISTLPGWSLISEQDPDRRSGIVTFRHRSGEHALILRRLRDSGVIAAERGGGIRLSPHCWQETASLERAVAAMDRAGNGGEGDRR